MKRKYNGILIAIALAGVLAGCSDAEADTNEALALAQKEETAQLEAEAVALEREKVVAEEKAKADAEAKAKVDAKKAEEAAAEIAKQKEVDEILAIFPELEAEIAKITDGVITEVKAEYHGSYFKIDMYVDETTWAYSSDSEKQSFATSFGTTIKNRIPMDSLVDFRSALNRDIIAEEKVFGGYDIKR